MNLDKEVILSQMLIYLSLMKCPNIEESLWGEAPPNINFDKKVNKG